MGKQIEAAQRVLRLQLREFFQILPAEAFPLIGVGMIPAPECVGRSKIAQPFVNRGAVFAQTARPETVNQYAAPVPDGLRFIHAFDGNRLHGVCSIIVKRFGERRGRLPG